jgi:hypothetical protein
MPDDFTLPALPAGVDPTTAQLPRNYQAAVQALARCERVDECRDWTIRTDALASYARQAGDLSLSNFAQRIRLRAVRRCGELLAEIDARGDHRRNSGHDTSSRTDTARDARMSVRQRVSAIRVSNVPFDQFERLVEQDRPPTVTYLADLGKQRRDQPARAYVHIVAREDARPTDHRVLTGADFARIADEQSPEMLRQALSWIAAHCRSRDIGAYVKAIRDADERQYRQWADALQLTKTILTELDAGGGWRPAGTA